MNYGVVAAVLFVFFALTFFVAQARKNHGLIDIVWGMGFIVSAGLSYAAGQPRGPVPLLMTLLVSLWGLRLTIHLARRNIGKPEDYRYANMRATWNPRTFPIRMFVQIYLLQLVLNFLINLPTIVTNLQGQTAWGPLAMAGLFVWLVGFFFESVGDWQLKRFRADPVNKGRLITGGLWRYSRHPNYFGEATQWWGLFCLAVSGNGRYWLVLSPVLITFFLLYVSGVPMLEKKYAGRPDWEAYKSRTSKFVPLPPR